MMSNRPADNGFTEILARGGRWFFEGEHISLKITGLYLFLGLSWVLFFCSLIDVPERVRDTIYVLSMGWLLYWLIEHGVKALRRSEGALKESEKRLAGILETSPCGILLIDRPGRIAYANLAVSNILGAKRSEIVGRRYRDIGWEITSFEGKPFPNEDLPGFRTLVDGNPVYDVECAVTVPGKDRVIMSFNSAPLYDRGGEIAGMVVAFLDITERKRAQDLMLRKLSLAVEQSPTAIMITDVESRIEYVNPSYTRMTGYSPEEVLGTRRTTMCDESAVMCEEVCENVCVRGEWKDDRRSLRKDGGWYWETVSVSPIRSADGGVDHYLWIREDVTEHRKIDEALRESQAKYQSLVETLSDWVWEVDGNGVYTYVSPKVRDLLGYEPEEIIGRTPFDLMPPDEARRVAEIFGRIAARREPFQGMENINLHKDGHAVVVETNGAPFFDASGEFLGYRGVDRDVTKRKKAEEELRESEERFREMFEQTEEPILLFAAGTATILDANQSAVKVYGFSREELIETGPSLFLEPAGAQEFERSIASMGETKGLSLEKVRHRRKDGAQIIVSVRGKSIRLKDGVVFYCTFRDITERIRLEEEAKIQQAKLIHANRMSALGTIVSGTAHELSNPNNLIMFNAPLLMSAWQDALPVLTRNYEENGEFSLGGVPFTEMRSVVPKLLKDISDSSHRIKRIVGMLKDFARNDERRQDGPVDVNEVVRTAIAILRHEITNRTRNFHVEYGENLPPVMGVGMELEQVVINLVVNSIQALPDASHGISISTALDGGPGHVEIVVRDEGTGMTRETLTRMMEPFFSTKLDSGGLGLGLSISRTIVQEHKGTISFESEIGKGTTARVVLPAAPHEAKAQKKGTRSRTLYS